MNKHNCPEKNGVMIPPIVQIFDARPPEKDTGVLSYMTRSPLSMGEDERWKEGIREYYRRKKDAAGI